MIKQAKVSKYMRDLAKKYMLDVSAFYNGDTNKVYKFTGNFLANFESLAREVKGYEKSNEYGNGHLVRSK